jgi:HNH endonuclease
MENDSSLDETTKKRLVDARCGQRQFRAEVGARWGEEWAVLGCKTCEVLRLSHIKPWRDSRDSENCNQERLDPNNGLLLTAHLDALFDSGLISFTDKGRMMISNKIVETDRKQLSLDGNLRNQPSEAMKRYLAYHRKKYNFERDHAT